MTKIAIIPARGGSKRIPRKNIKEFLGKPIIAYSIEAALRSGVFDEVMVSTDDQEIAEIAQKYGAQVPFYRSPEMSSDMAMTAPVLIEVLQEYEERGRKFEHVCCVYPCAPFIRAGRLQEGLALLLRQPQFDNLLPLVRFSYPPQRCFVIRQGQAYFLHPENYNVRSQDLEPYYHDAGQFYFTKTEFLLREQKMNGKNTLPLILPESEVQDIDTEEDWKIAEMKYKILYNV
ncbi:glycosyl transferase GTA-type super family [Candidatus Termititenax persephonae]|uniref:Glycosyl transferase GTA-type super family n=1 Tax=Candidatus Termititenax persephonae TaxID=2218525 RepID=A0A388TFF9_9BACT|nr:glycosyl transferase GTA-type super family [Candidatus Termititenax persephonae]